MYSCIHAGPPNIRKGGQCERLISDQLLHMLVVCDNIGTNFCIPDLDPAPPSIDIFLRCVHDSTATPVTPYPLRLMWFHNGVLFARQTPFIIAPILVNATRGNYTCQLTNTAGSDVATTIVSNCSSK